MITENHGAFPLGNVARPDKKVIGDLNFRRSQDGRDLGESRPSEDVAAFHADYLTRPKLPNCKKPAAVNGASFDGRLGRKIGKWLGHQQRYCTATVTVSWELADPMLI